MTVVTVKMPFDDYVQLIEQRIKEFSNGWSEKAEALHKEFIEGLRRLAEAEIVFPSVNSLVDNFSINGDFVEYDLDYDETKYSSREEWWDKVKKDAFCHNDKIACLGFYWDTTK
jgi:hypothetical protein